MADTPRADQRTMTESDNGRGGIGIHTKAYRGVTDEWLTPPGIIKALGSFDLDPCAPINRPWDTATNHYTAEDDGLAQKWEGRVWLNPPYGPQTWKWLDRLRLHGDGIALTFARTETAGFFKTAWAADALLFFKGRLHFHYPTGERAGGNAGGPSVLLAFGDRNVQALRDSGIPGAFISNPEIWEEPPKVVDLMEDLRRSVAAAKKRRGE